MSVFDFEQRNRENLVNIFIEELKRVHSTRKRPQITTPEMRKMREYGLIIITRNGRASRNHYTLSDMCLKLIREKKDSPT